MAVTARQLAESELIIPLVRQLSGILYAAYQAESRMGSVFATQQRWLLAHAALGLHFRSATSAAPPITLTRFLDKVAEHGVASRNTAHAFIQEMVNYGYARMVDDMRDRRSRHVMISDGVLAAISGWVLAHLTVLDRFDGGSRAETVFATDGGIALIEVEIAEGLLTSPAIRQPRDTFSLFTWLNNGGVIMDRLVLGLGEPSADGARYPTAIASIGQVADMLRLSRTHLARKLREAEAMGSLGWTGRRGASTMWVSAGFVREMIAAQAEKLAVIDAAYAKCFPR